MAAQSRRSTDIYVVYRSTPCSLDTISGFSLFDLLDFRFLNICPFTGPSMQQESSMLVHGASCTTFRFNSVVVALRNGFRI